MIRAVTRVVAMAVLVGSILVGAPQPAEAACATWSGPVSTLQSTINANSCVTVTPGTYELSARIILGSGKTLTGQTGQRANTIFRAGPNFPTEPPGALGSSTMVDMSSGGTIRHLTLDGATRAQRGVCCNNFTVDNVRVLNMVCDGIDINGTGVTVRNSEIAYNARNASGQGICNSAAAPYGGGIYLQAPFGSAISAYATIENNWIHHNFGMGIDINGVHHGTIAGNSLHDNNGPAAIGLYGASYWTIRNNNGYHPFGATFSTAFHPRCFGGPIGQGSAGLMVCQDTDANGYFSVGNYVHDNHFAGKYGIISIGNDEAKPYWAPRNSTYANNSVVGSQFGCADDFVPGQWFNDQNYWPGTNCGSPSGAPAYF